MRRSYFFTFGCALLMAVPAVAAGQTDTGCGLPSPIETVPWARIQSYLQGLESVRAFDRNPFVSDRQSLVEKLRPGKRARSTALVAGRPAIRDTPQERLQQGCFVGMIESEGAEPDVGAFQGKTFVWVDSLGPGGTWRTLQFPLDGESRLDAAGGIEMPYLMPGVTKADTGWVAPGDVHFVYEGSLYRSGLDAKMDQFIGARWIIRPPSLLPTFPLGAGFASLQAFILARQIEVMACFRCDHVVCCPDELDLRVFSSR